ncbi:MAG: molybdopterin-dependent oxidoreductase [Methanomicrobiales archaeon]|nr:molybdopterin-dependent oxidoreductase [Methanomicrobiales archaeon]
MDFKRSLLLIIIIAVVVVYIADITGLFIKPGVPETNTSRVLAAVEVKNYQGERLSSITDFRENSIKGPQHVNISNYRLEIEGLVTTPTNLTYDEVKGFPDYRKVVTLHCVEGWDATILWQGIKVGDLLKKTGVGADANTVIFYASDGYSTSLSLDYIEKNDILLAYGMNNVTLPEDRGYPFQLLAEDKWGYKWIKWVTRIEISNDPSYRGYWEQRGYAIGGDTSDSFFA